MQTPFLLPALVFSIGIYMGLTFEIGLINTVLFLGIAICLYLFFPSTLYVHQKRLNSIFLLLVLGVLGMGLGSLAQEQRQAESLTETIFASWEGQVTEVHETAKGKRLMVDIKKINQSEFQTHTCIWVKNTSIEEGQIICWEGTLRPITDSLQAQNGFYLWLFQKGYSSLGYTSEVTVVGESYSIATFIGHIRSHLIHQIRYFIKIEGADGLAVAILLGDRSGLNDEMKNDFTVAGAAHILAVSGMHVQLILSVLLFILSYFSSKIRFFIPLIIIILYGFLAGGSPAVVRAVIMGVFSLVATFFKKELPLANSLSVTLFLQLLWDPFALMDLGLQLSYAAIAGIIWIAPALPIPMPTSAIKAWIAENIRISIAAQVATLPLILLHFGQFPLYFLITNLLLVPIGNIATILGFIFIPLSYIEVCAEGFGLLTAYAFKILIESAHLIAKLPYASLTNLHINHVFALLFGSLIIAWTALQLKKARSLQNSVKI